MSGEPSREAPDKAEVVNKIWNSHRTGVDDEMLYEALSEAYDAGWQARISTEGIPEPDEGKMPTGDDVVIAVRHVLVPNNMKCHKCGAPDP